MCLYCTCISPFILSRAPVPSWICHAHQLCTHTTDILNYPNWKLPCTYSGPMAHITSQRQCPVSRLGSFPCLHLRAAGSAHITAPRTMSCRASPPDPAGQGPPQTPPPQEPSTSSSQQQESWRGDQTPAQVFDKYLRPYYLPGSFAFGALTFGTSTANGNFDLGSDPFGYLACMAVSGGLIMALVWVTVDLFDDNPPPSNGSNPNLT